MDLLCSNPSCHLLTSRINSPTARYMPCQWLAATTSGAIGFSTASTLVWPYRDIARRPIGGECSPGVVQLPYQTPVFDICLDLLQKSLLSKQPCGVIRTTYLDNERDGLVEHSQQAPAIRKLRSIFIPMLPHRIVPENCESHSASIPSFLCHHSGLLTFQ